MIIALGTRSHRARMHHVLEAAASGPAPRRCARGDSRVATLVKSHTSHVKEGSRVRIKTAARVAAGEPSTLEQAAHDAARAQPIRNLQFGVEKDEIPFSYL